jgi:hypothetical protein
MIRRECNHACSRSAPRGRSKSEKVDPYVSENLSAPGPAEVAPKLNRGSLPTANRTPNQWDSQPSNQRRRAHRAITDVMYKIKANVFVQFPRLPVRQRLPQKIEARALQAPVTRTGTLPPRKSHPEKTEVVIWMLGKEGFDALTVVRIRQNQNLVSPGELPGPVPGDTRLRALPWTTGVAYQ